MRFFPVILVLIFSVLATQAQPFKPIRWTYSLSKSSVRQGETIEIIMKAEINADWYLYSSDFDPTLGPTVTSLSLENNAGFKIVGDLKPVSAKEKYDSLWGGKVRYFLHHAEFRQKVKILKANPVIKGTLSYQVCSDKEGKCIPFDDSFVFDKIEVVASAEKTPVTPDTSVKSPTTIDSTKTPSPKTNDNRLAELEAEKKKLVIKDEEGNDKAVEQLKEFSQKYGGAK